jgi:RluA family pseudouridine synthase
MIPLLYDDDDLVAINKPAGISSIPERDLSIASVLSLLQAQLTSRLFIVHRLDKEVSGVMLFAKTAAAHRFLNREFLSRGVRKTYCALVHGVVKEEKGVIEKNIRQFGSGRMGIDEEKGKPSATEYAVRARFDAHTLVSVFPLTGRRHQIRVHLYSIGHPIAGDPLYGDMRLLKGYPRLMLHSESIAFKLPKGKEMAISSPLPPEFGLAW